MEKPPCSLRKASIASASRVAPSPPSSMARMPTEACLNAILEGLMATKVGKEEAKRPKDSSRAG